MVDGGRGIKSRVPRGDDKLAVTSPNLYFRVFPSSPKSRQSSTFLRVHMNPESLSPFFSFPETRKHAGQSRKVPPIYALLSPLTRPRPCEERTGKAETKAVIFSARACVRTPTLRRESPPTTAAGKNGAAAGKFTEIGGGKEIELVDSPPPPHTFGPGRTREFWGKEPPSPGGGHVLRSAPRTSRQERGLSEERWCPIHKCVNEEVTRVVVGRQAQSTSSEGVF